MIKNDYIFLASNNFWLRHSFLHLSPVIILLKIHFFKGDNMSFLSTLAKVFLQFGAIRVVIILVLIIGGFYLFKNLKKKKRDA